MNRYLQIDTTTGESQTHPNLSNAANGIGVHVNTLIHAFKSSDRYFKDPYLMEKLPGIPFKELHKQFEKSDHSTFEDYCIREGYKVFPDRGDYYYRKTYLSELAIHDKIL